MANPKINYFVDAGMAIAFILVAATGIIKFPRLMRLVGVRQLPFGTISLIHNWSGIALAALVLLHLILHWKWIVSMTKTFFKKEGKCEKK